MTAKIDNCLGLQRRNKKEKVRPILVNSKEKENNVIIDSEIEVPTANHFEELHPKDEFELLHSHIVSYNKCRVKLCT